MAKVQQEQRVDGFNDLISINAQLTADIYNDGKMSLSEKMKCISQGTRNVVSVHAEQRKTALDLTRMGQKLNGQIDALSYDPVKEDE